MSNNSQLKPFQQGFDPRRQRGRKKGSVNRKTAVRKLLEANVDMNLVVDQQAREYCEKLKDKTFLEAVSVALLNKALTGETKSANILLNTLAETEPEKPQDDMRWEIVVVPNRKDLDLES